MINEQAFVDESGTHDDAPLTVVGGYLFTPHAAEEFQNAWRERIRPLADKTLALLI